MANALPQAKLEELRAIILRSLKRRFKSPREPKYGSLNKGFTEQELTVFLRRVKSGKFRLLFEYQAFLGLRIGEVCQSSLISNLHRYKFLLQMPNSIVCFKKLYF
ncbi:MAG: hypothetical protein QXW10_00060 [Candidatus Micrarchaeaceae archaeon]